MADDKSPVMLLLDGLPLHQQDAIKVIKLALDCYNSLEGSGFFKGMERYNVLQARAEIAAVQSQSLFDFWSNLQRRMHWTLPPKRADLLVVSALTGKDDGAVLATLQKDIVSIITIARLLHDNDKAARKALREIDKKNDFEMAQALLAPIVNTMHDDKIDF